VQKITACLDTNVLISAIAFGGKPLRLVERALNREFMLVLGPNIVHEVRRNLVGKLNLSKTRVDRFLGDITEVSSVYAQVEKSD